MREWDGIYFLLDGKEYSRCFWEHVPHIGNWIQFSPTDEVFEVKQVIWRKTKSMERLLRDRVYVEIILKKVE